MIAGSVLVTGSLPDVQTAPPALRRQARAWHDVSMMTVAVAAGLLAGAVHVGVWIAESFLWRRRAVWRAFGVEDQATANAMASVLFNQGFYNLFLGLGAVGGAVQLGMGDSPVLLMFSCAFMTAAALVLLITSRQWWIGSLVQGVPPAVALAAGVSWIMA